MKEGKWGRNLYFNIFQTLLLFEYSFVFFLTFFNFFFNYLVCILKGCNCGHGLFNGIENYWTVHQDYCLIRYNSM